MATQAPFPISNPTLTAIALSYRNQALVADMVLPRVSVGKMDFKYFKFNQAEPFTVPDTKIGRRGEARMVEFGGVETADYCVDYGLKDVVPVHDIANAEGSPFDPMRNATLNLTRLVALDREIRVAAKVFATGSYAAGNQSTLSGTSQWSDYTNSNPLSAMLTAMDSMIMRPNKLVLGQEVWTKLRQHPRIVEAIKATGAGVNAQGTVTRQQVADLLELQEVIVGQAFVNNAKKGQTPSFARTWGKFASLIYTEPVTGTEAATTFGFTAEFGGGQRVRDWFDQSVGADGGQTVQVVDTVKEVLPANDLGYLFAAAIA